MTMPFTISTQHMEQIKDVYTLLIEKCHLNRLRNIFLYVYAYSYSYHDDNNDSFFG